MRSASENEGLRSDKVLDVDIVTNGFEEACENPQLRHSTE